MKQKLKKVILLIFFHFQDKQFLLNKFHLVMLHFFWIYIVAQVLIKE